MPCPTLQQAAASPAAANDFFGGRWASMGQGEDGVAGLMGQGRVRVVDRVKQDGDGAAGRVEGGVDSAGWVGERMGGLVWAS